MDLCGFSTDKCKLYARKYIKKHLVASHALLSLFQLIITILKI